MRDLLNEPCVPVVKETEHTKAFEKLKSLLSSYKQEDRTVLAWNYLRNEYKKDYAPEVIRMLDASGFIVKWLKNEK